MRLAEAAGESVTIRSGGSGAFFFSSEGGPSEGFHYREIDRPMQAFEATNHYFDRAAARLDLTDNTRTMMITPDRELRVEVAVEMDDGRIGNFIGYRVQHDNARGPFKGGLRYHPHVDQDEARAPGQPDDLEDGRRRPALRRRQRGMNCDPSRLSRRQSSERVTRKFVQQIHDFIGPDKDIPAPDVGTDAQVMAWIMNEYGKFTASTPPA